MGAVGNCRGLHGVDLSLSLSLSLSHSHCMSLPPLYLPLSAPLSPPFSSLSLSLSLSHSHYLTLPLSYLFPSSLSLAHSLSPHPTSLPPSHSLCSIIYVLYICCVNLCGCAACMFACVHVCLHVFVCVKD